MKMDNRIISVLSVALILGMLIVPGVSAKNNMTNGVDLEDAELIASYYVQYVPTFLEDFDEWKNATVKSSTTFYGLEGQMTAYSFDVLDGEQYAGYILISATKDNYPVLGFSKGKIPTAINEMTTSSDFVAEVQASSEKLSVGHATPLYLGGTFYCMEYSFVDAKGNVVKKELVDLTTSKMMKGDENQDENLSKMKELFDTKENEKIQQIKKKEAKEQWDSIESRMSNNFESSVSTRSIGWISGVPLYEWRAGCTPTSAGMVLGYWRNNGYSELPIGTTLIDELASEMGTYNWPEDATWPWDMDNGIKAVCDNHGYSSISASNDYLLSWSDTKNQIDNGRPFVLSMTYGGVGSGYEEDKPYGMHSVTCIGYSDGTENYVFLHDTWDTENHHYLVFGDWVAAMGTWVVP
ncbi:MAG: C39 family peptidase [Methanolobus sp.]|jgi:hypothetical protein|nr:C39 family peptidase [Methanolobus sp.]